MNLAEPPKGAFEWIMFWALIGPLMSGVIGIVLMMLKDAMGDLPRGLRWTEKTFLATMRGLRWVLLRTFYPERLKPPQKPVDTGRKAILRALEGTDENYRRAYAHHFNRGGGHPEWNDRDGYWY